MTVHHPIDRRSEARPGDPDAPLVPRARRAERSDGAPVLEVVPLGEAHHRWVADLHVHELPHGLFPRLGRRFVQRWHRAHVDSSFGVGAVALEDGVPVGFVLGSTDRRAHVAWLLAHRRRALLVAGALALAVRPAVLAEFLRTRAGRYARRLLGRAPQPPTEGTTGPDDAPGDAPGGGPVAVLEAVVVVPGARTRGIGTRLTAVVVDAARAAGAARVDLVTKAGAGGAAGFYERGGWQRVGSHVDRDGDEVHTFRLPLTPHWTA